MSFVNYEMKIMKNVQVFILFFMMKLFINLIYNFCLEIYCNIAMSNIHKKIKGIYHCITHFYIDMKYQLLLQLTYSLNFLYTFQNLPFVTNPNIVTLNLFYPLLKHTSTQKKDI